MKIGFVLIVACFCTVCMFETQRALGCNNIFGCKDKPRLGTNVVSELIEAEERTSVLTNSRGESYRPGTPSWVPLIDNCIIAGGSRGDCIEALPPEELAKLEKWEQRHATWRRRSPTTGTFGTERN